MYKLKLAAKTAPVAPKAAVVARAGMYFGAEDGKKMFDDTRPITLARGTPTEVRITRRPSWGTLLLLYVILARGLETRKVNVPSFELTSGTMKRNKR
jgi:hypothetical protein